MPKRWIEDSQEIADFLEKARVGRLGTCRDGQPHVTPVAFVYRDGNFYFHSLSRGRKLDNIRANGKVCFEVDELARVHIGDSGACNHSMRYTSVIAAGEARLVADEDRKRQILGWLVDKYAGAESSHEMKARELAETTVVEIAVKELKAKRNVDQ